jgi:GNAT superfamily N-acetyltransferase
LALSPEIRPARADDGADLAALIRTFRDSLGAASPTDDDVDRVLPELLEDADVDFVCARLEECAVGYTQTRYYTSVWAAGTEAWLDDLYVAEPARGHGVGRALLRVTLERARARGARQIRLSTNEKNDGARPLYHSEGFTPVSEPRYAAGREIVWSKELA